LPKYSRTTCLGWGGLNPVADPQPPPPSSPVAGGKGGFCCRHIARGKWCDI
jgi:hypothetical protein